MFLRILKPGPLQRDQRTLVRPRGYRAVAFQRNDDAVSHLSRSGSQGPAFGDLEWARVVDATMRTCL